jgi:nucleoside-diphosphate-sugar epimerase
MVCHRKDRRVDRVPSLSRAARQRFHLCDADEPLRAGDNFDLEGAHVLPALLRRFRAAARTGDGKVTIWGTGTPRRKFLHVDDCADALVFLLRHYSDEQTINAKEGIASTYQWLERELAEHRSPRGFSFDIEHAA